MAQNEPNEVELGMLYMLVLYLVALNIHLNVLIRITCIFSYKPESRFRIEYR